MARDLLFISHANPEDNDFTRWLALRLAAEGYGVWCDLTKLLGGEAFWTDIEIAIRERAAKVIYVLSRTSNEKVGPLKELQVAQNVARDESLHDFVVPMLIDALPARKINIRLADTNAISCRDSWASGLALILKKLEEDGVPKNPAFGADAVASWWREQFTNEHGVKATPETYISNRLAIESLPATIYVHELRGRMQPVESLPPPREATLFLGYFVAPAVEPPPPFTFPELWSFAHPCARKGDRLVSFAGADELFTGAEDFAVTTLELPLDGFLDAGSPDGAIVPPQSRNMVLEVLRVAFERTAKARGLRRHLLANKRGAMFFPLDVTRNGRVDFVDVDGVATYRKLVGGKRKIKRFWHFAIQVRPLLEPTPQYIVNTHVLFSDNGHTIWDSAARLHSARRSQCKRWFNPEWRDRMLTALQFIANGGTAISVPVASGTSLEVPTKPMGFESLVSYADPNTEEYVEEEHAPEEPPDA